MESHPDHTRPILKQVDNKEAPPVLSRPILKQGIVAGLVYITAVCNGLSSGYSAILLPQLRSNSSTITMNDDIGSWIVSIYIGATSIGCLLSGVVMDFCGRCPTIQVGILCNCVGWLFIAFAQTHTPILLGRALGGFAKGFLTPAVTFHLEEMADPRLRGALSACILLTFSVGIMLISMLGINISWQISAGIGAAVCVINLVGYSFLPESPVWLVRNNRINKASDVFKWLWGNSYDVQIQCELHQLVNRLHEEKSELDNATQWKLKQHLKPHILKPFFIIHVFNILQVVCGTNIFIFYAVDILSGTEANGDLDANFTNILTSGTRVLFMAMSCIMLVWIGRRPMSITSGVGSGIAAVVLGSVIYFRSDNTLLMTTLVIIYVAFNTYGYFVLPPSMIGEILPSKIRCLAGAFIFTCNDIAMFAATKAFPSVARAVGTHGLFWIFGGSSLFCALLLYLLLPETKGRSLVEVEEYFLQSNIFWFARKKQCAVKVANSHTSVLWTP